MICECFLWAINPTTAPELNRAQSKVELQFIAHLQVEILLFRSQWELGIVIFNSVFIFSGPQWNTHFWFIWSNLASVNWTELKSELNVLFDL